MAGLGVVGGVAAFRHLLTLESLQAVGGELGKAAARAGVRMQTAAQSACFITPGPREGLEAPWPDGSNKGRDSWGRKESDTTERLK